MTVTLGQLYLTTETTQLNHSFGAEVWQDPFLTQPYSCVAAYGIRAKFHEGLVGFYYRKERAYVTRILLSV